MCRLRRPEREVKRRARAGLALGPNPAAVPVDDAPHAGQADAPALELLRAVQPLEHAKELALYRMSKPTPLSRTNTMSRSPSSPALPASIWATSRGPVYLNTKGLPTFW